MILGIDISSNNHPNNAPIDWKLIARCGIVDFAMIKASEGTDYQNPFYDDDLVGARGAGLEIVHYHFDRADLNQPAANEMANFINTVGALFLGEAMMIDSERGAPGLNNRLTVETETVQQIHGIWPFLYTRADFAFANQLNDNANLARCGLHLADWQTDHFPDPISGWPFVAIWQFSDVGQIPGISGPVDLNIFNGTRDQLRAYGRSAS